MTTTSQGVPSDGAARRMSFERAQRMLSSGGLARRRRPVESLIERLCAEDAPEWVERAVGVGADGGAGEAPALVPNGSVSLAQLVAAKIESKGRHGRAEGPEERLAARLRYFLALALALVRHDELITSRAHDEVSQVLSDLAEVAPEPWRGVLAEAARKARDRSS